jgi:hypothetical protein
VNVGVYKIRLRNDEKEEWIERNKRGFGILVFYFCDLYIGLFEKFGSVIKCWD